MININKFTVSYIDLIEHAIKNIKMENHIPVKILLHIVTYEKLKLEFIDKCIINNKDEVPTTIGGYEIIVNDVFDTPKIIYIDNRTRTFDVEFI